MVWVLDEQSKEWTGTIGRGVIAEVPNQGGRYSSGGALADVSRIVEAVVNRGCTETTWEYQGEVVRSTGLITVDGAPVVLKWTELRPLAWLFSRRKTTSYSPY
jgi:hypothetical protein